MKGLPKERLRNSVSWKVYPQNGYSTLSHERFTNWTAMQHHLMKGLPTISWKVYSKNCWETPSHERSTHMQNGYKTPSHERSTQRTALKHHLMKGLPKERLQNTVSWKVYQQNGFETTSHERSTQRMATKHRLMKVLSIPRPTFCVVCKMVTFSSVIIMIRGQSQGNLQLRKNFF